MFRMGGTDTPGRGTVGVRLVLIWLGRILLLLLIAVSLFVAAAGLAGSAPYLGYLASRATVFDIWGVLHALAVLLALTAIAGAGIAVFRRKLLLAIAFGLLAWPMGFVIEGSRCDTEASCRMLGWAAMPASARDWSIRIRPVTDTNEARHIASAALFDARSDYSPYNAKRFDDHWIVATIEEDGWPGPRAVRIDTRTAATRFVPCPADRMLCGMERPVVSDDGQVFSNARLGLAATFPAGRAVCTARPFDDDLSYDGTGFYGMIRDADEPCDIVDLSRDMGLEALKVRTVEEALRDPCQPMSPGVLKAFEGRPPGFVGHQSVVCEEIAQDQIAVGVYALAGPHPDSGNASSTLHVAWMRTDPAHLAEDARSFEAFLGTARIPAPAR